MNLALSIVMIFYTDTEQQKTSAYHLELFPLCERSADRKWRSRSWSSLISNLRYLPRKLRYVLNFRKYYYLCFMSVKSNFKPSLVSLLAQKVEVCLNFRKYSYFCFMSIMLSCLFIAALGSAVAQW